MGILDFLKKIFSEPEKTEPTRVKIAFSGIEEFIKKKSENLKTKENETISLINGKIKSFTNELKEKIKIANNVNFESKEKNDRIKSAVYEGRKKYIEFLEKFIETLETSENAFLEKFMENINLAFTRFNESSAKSYERATILIGKEMGSIKEILKNLSNEILAIFNENKDVISDYKKISLIELKTSEIKEINEKLLKIETEITNLINKILEKEKETKEISDKINQIKNSPEYIENIEKEKSIQIQEKEVEKEIFNLKQAVDFKALSNFFHIFEDKMAIVKIHRDDFLSEFKKDGGIRLFNLLNESKLNNENISYKLRQIQEKEQEIISKRNEIKKDETQSLASELDKANEELRDLTVEKRWAEKKKEKLKVNQSEILKIIKEELGFIGVDLED